jgi:hypothetical protein
MFSIEQILFLGLVILIFTCWLLLFRNQIKILRELTLIKKHLGIAEPSVDPDDETYP